MPSLRPLISSNAQLLADIKTNFMKTYQMEPSGILKSVKDVIEEVPMERRQDRFFYYKSLPLVERIPYNTEVKFGTLDQESYTIDAYKYGHALSWSEDDEKDDLTRSLPQQGRRLSEQLKNLPVRIFFQMLTAATNALLLPSVPDAPDGAALYSATDGAGSARFGATGGNLVTGTGTTSAAIKTDFFTVMTRFTRFLHTDLDTPLLPDGAREEVLIMAPPDLLEGMSEAFERTLVANGSSVFEGSNVFKDSGYNIRVEFTPYLTDPDDWYVFLPKANIQPIVMGSREKLQTREFNSSNSATQAVRFESFFMAWERQGWTTNLPYSTIKVSQ